MKDKYFGMSPRIARWKLNNPVERWMSYRADTSEFWKKLYVLYYQIFDRKYYLGGLKYVKEEIDRALTLDENTSERSVIRDMVYCLHRFGFSFEDYSIYDFLHNRSVQYRDSFVADKLRYHYCDILNSPDILPLMTDKYACYLKYKPFFKRDMVGCFQEKDRSAFMDFVTKHTAFIFKPLNEHSGQGIDIVKTSDITPQSFFDTKLASGPFVLEELIVQGKETAAMHPQSVNSCRVVTFFLENEVHIMGVTWRIGTGDSIKDNAGAGGIYASIDPLTGMVETDAINYESEVLESHPDTGIRFKGYQLPDWEEATQLINAMTRQVAGTTLIAWDIAYSDKGWLMVEANDNGDWRLIQSNKKIGKKAELYSFMDRYFKK